jgi:uncharacterized membrane protein
VIFARTLFNNLGFYVKSALGGELGWFQSEIAAPLILVAVFALIVLVAFLKTPEDDLRITRKQRIVYLLIPCVGLLAIMFTMFTTYTLTTESEVVGVQGRYLLPFLPLIALAVRSNTITSSKNLRHFLLLGMCVLNAAYLTYLVAAITAIV